ncbi:MAG: AAA family ATPase [Alphaproteobacteria bacterium]|nr:AAA family ATPase [Alphaproteobacteria bacterium]
MLPSSTALRRKRLRPSLKVYLMALYHFSVKMISRGSRNTVSAVAYRAGCKLYDDKTGQSFDQRSKDVEHVELLLPKDAPAWAVDVQKLMGEDRQKGVQAFVDIVEASEKRVDARIWREFEFALHRELTKEQNMALAREFVEDQLCARGMAAQLNFHFDKEEKTGDENHHCHVLVTTRRLDEEGMNSKKEEDWNKKELLLELRAQWQEYSNFHLKLNGHDVRVDHRSHKDRGIDIEPQPKMGKGVLEMERRANPKNKPDSFVTDKAQEFHDTQLRNLYRIMRRPDVVLDIVSKHHSTFMWADVRRVLHRYVDELPLFQKLEAKLKNSNELMLLKADLEGKSIYTTRTLLKAERSLIENADALGKAKSHGVQASSIDPALEKADEELKQFGGLSSDQVKAIHHLVDEGQLKCVVGIAGAGKTTALGVCHDIWKAEGYSVYGLAPTGKAAQNLETKSLEQSGIPSSTLHKFLKEFEEGRCQYNQNSVLILDEAGMVDMERFEQLLRAVKQLGVKLIVVGDGAQLQPVEAGPAFRLVTTRLGKVELNTVVRQRQEWQREATVLFGKQHTQAAIQKYMDKGHVHIVEEKLPTLHEVLDRGDREGVLKLYEVSTRTSSLIYREMMRDINKSNPEGSPYSLAKQHQDFGRYLEWKSIQKSSAAQILKKGEAYAPFLEARSLDPLRLADLFVDKRQDKTAQEQQAVDLLKKCGLDELVGLKKQPGFKPGQGLDVRQCAKAALIQAWHSGFKDAPEKSSIMLAFSNRDTNDLNRSARALLKESGHIERHEFTYTIAKRIEDDFEREYIIKQQKNFSKGDRIVFTQNTKSLGVKNGTMGTITDLKPQTMKVKLDEGKEISFAPNLNPYFDQGWAITIHKSQGTTVDQTYMLASFEMTQNLAYVAMTRHREDVQVFGSSLDFWRPEKLPEALAKSGEKLSPGDYLDADSLNKLMQQDDRLLTKIFERVSNELDAMGAVSKKAFWQVADHFLGSYREKDIRVTPDVSQTSIREEARAEQLLQKKVGTPISSEISMLQHTSQTTTHYSNSDFEGRTYSPSSARVALNHMDITVVEDAIKQNMTSFADDIFSSIGEPYNSASSSSQERRYGKNGHIAVNLKTGAWIDHKNSEMAGGPLHMLMKLKGLEFKEALEYGASWAGLDRTDLNHQVAQPLAPTVQTLKKEAGGLNEEEKARIDRAQALWDKGRPIQGTLAERYLREHRKIEGVLSDDLRYLPFFTDPNSKYSFPCLMAAARSPEGDVTAVQLTFLNAHTALKADIPVAKRSFGVLKGSAVAIQDVPVSNVLFLAEGVETALSLRSAGIQGTIKATLGLSNIKRIVPESLNTQIIICADHDAPDSPAAQSLEKSVLALQERGLAVTVIKPDKLGEDFNDVLKNKGPQGVREILERSFLESNSLEGNPLEGSPLEVALPKDSLKIVSHQKEPPSQALMLELSLEKSTFEKEIGENTTFENRPAENSVGTSLQKSESKPTFVAQIPPKEKPLSPTREMVFEELTKGCARKLYANLGEERCDLTPDLTKGIDRQAKRAANFIFHAHTLKGTRPTDKQTDHYLQRANYELDRIPEIREEIIAGWKKVDSYRGEKDELIAHMMAERQASVEGRMYLEVKQSGLKPEGFNPPGLTTSSTIPHLAKEEIKQNRATTVTLAEKLATKQRLSETAATQCAKDITRYMETHGQKPSSDQMSAMAQISRDLDKEGYDPSIGTHNIEYLRRRDGDLRFRDWSASIKGLSGFRDFPHAVQDYTQPQARTKSYRTEKPVGEQKENRQGYGMDM